MPTGDWRVATLKALKAPITKSNLQFLGSWQRWEGGATNNNAHFNWLNTTHGSQYPSINSVGVRSYPDFNTGVSILAGVLQNGYPGITKLLKSGQGSRAVLDPQGQTDLNKWLTGNAVSGPSQYVSKIAGTLGVKFPLAGGSSGSPGSTIKDTSPTKAIASPETFAPAIFNAPGFGDSFQPKPISTATGGPKTPTGNLFGTLPAFHTLQFKAGPLPPVTVQHDTTVPVDQHTKGVVQLAREYLGTKYVYGGNTPSGFDCSGFVQWCFAHMGVSLPRTTWDQIKVGTAVNPNALKAGDVLFFNNGEHEALYIGNGKVIQAPHTGTVVQITALKNMGPIYAARRMA